MTSTWYGAKYGMGDISNNFAFVPSFYTYATSSKTVGPKATGYGDVSTGSFDILSVGTGNVIQLYNTSQAKWYHSLYATYKSSSSIDPQVLVTAHQTDYIDRDILEYLNNTMYSKVRGMRFSSASFDS
jgi:hypothetical protein